MAHFFSPLFELFDFCSKCGLWLPVLDTKLLKPCDFLSDGSDFCSNGSRRRAGQVKDQGMMRPLEFSALPPVPLRRDVLKMEFMSAMPMWWRLHKVLKVWGSGAPRLVNMQRFWDSVMSQEAGEAPCSSHKRCPASSLPFGYSWHWFQYFTVATLFFEILFKRYHLVFCSHSWAHHSMNHDIEQTLIGIGSSVGIGCLLTRASVQVLLIAKFHHIYIYLDKTNLSVYYCNEMIEIWKLN